MSTTEQAVTSTPSSRWHQEGKPDPHGDLYSGERARTAMGHLTDDEVANAVYLFDHRTGLQSIAYLTAAKERIRWLSRSLVRALQTSLTPVRADDRLEIAARAYIAACEGRHPDPDSALSRLVDEGVEMSRITGITVNDALSIRLLESATGFDRGYQPGELMREAALKIERMSQALQRIVDADPDDHTMGSLRDMAEDGLAAASSVSSSPKAG